VVYYAEGKPFKGPFPALVDLVHEQEEDDESLQPKINLRVFFSGLENEPTVKTNVPYSLDPQKFHWGHVPGDWTWPEPAPNPVEES
jgi:hypothetical protein